MGVVGEYLSASEKLYAHLSVMPENSERDVYIDQIDALLNEREVALLGLESIEKSALQAYPSINRLIELDRGIVERLSIVMNAVKVDLKDLQQQKRSESSYTNPYAATQVSDGMFFDNKK